MNASDPESVRTLTLQTMTEKLTLDGVEQFTNYRRELDLTTATATTRFESDGRVFIRQSFISASSSSG